MYVLKAMCALVPGVPLGVVVLQWELKLAALVVMLSLVHLLALPAGGVCDRDDRELLFLHVRYNTGYLRGQAPVGKMIPRQSRIQEVLPSAPTL